MLLSFSMKELLQMGAFQIVAGWWGHQPGQPAVGGVSTAHNQPGYAIIWNAPLQIYLFYVMTSTKNTREFRVSSSVNLYGLQGCCFLFARGIYLQVMTGHHAAK